MRQRFTAWVSWGAGLLCLGSMCAAGEVDRAPPRPRSPRVLATPHPLLRSENGDDSRVRLTQFDGGPAAKYIVAWRDSAEAAPVREWLWPVPPLVPTDLVYDCTEAVLHGKAKPLFCDLSERNIRVLAILPTQVGQIDMRSAAAGLAGERFAASVEFQDAGGKRLAGMLPWYAALFQPNGDVLQEAFLMTDADGRGTLSWRLPSDMLPGTGRLLVRSLLNGLIASSPVTFTAR